ncbi:MAG: FkbM family methyltransferase [Candidatus Nanopelagicales bacterium]|nr:FkbM family methyltransferase [Candidatus Nanopelagicales bacterium]
MRKVGLEVGRFPQDTQGNVLFRALLSARPGMVLDIGANNGGFARTLRSFGYGGDIVSFEPGEAARRDLVLSAETDEKWNVRGEALGDFDGSADLNVTANAGASSSLVDMLDRHVEAAPDAKVVKRESVRVRRLDSIVAAGELVLNRPVLKIDVQGYERQVLAGCGRLLNRIVAVQLELSVEPLYAGAWDWQEAIEWLEAEGYRLRGLEPGFCDSSTGVMLQFDAVLCRDDDQDSRDSIHGSRS